MTTHRSDTDARRERVLAAYDALDRPPRRELDALVELAARVAGVPFAAVNLFTADTQHQVATTGFEGQDSAREDALCRVVVESGQSVMVEDAARDARFAHSPWTTGETGDVKFYGSHPLTTPSGVILWTMFIASLATYRLPLESKSEPLAVLPAGKVANSVL